MAFLSAATAQAAEPVLAAESEPDGTLRTVPYHDPDDLARIAELERDREQATDLHARVQADMERELAATREAHELEKRCHERTWLNRKALRAAIDSAVELLQGWVDAVDIDATDAHPDKALSLLRAAQKAAT